MIGYIGWVAGDEMELLILQTFKPTSLAEFHVVNFYSGGIVFGDDDIAEHVPQRRPAALHRLLGSIAAANTALHAGHTANAPIDLNDVLRAAVRISATNSMIAVFSDFDGLDDYSEPLLRQLAAKNDLILFQVADGAASALPDNLRMAISDGDVQADLDTTDIAVRERIDAALRDRLANLQQWSRKYGFPIVPLGTEKPALDQLMHLFGHTGGQR